MYKVLFRTTLSTDIYYIISRGGSGNEISVIDVHTHTQIFCMKKIKTNYHGIAPSDGYTHTISSA
jgi:hypothetical protein